MATLKEISMRLKSVSNIAKITKSMKMIASTKVAKAQRTMEAAPFYEHAGTKSDAGSSLVVAVSSDRGLCGGIHSSISKATKKYLAKNEQCSTVIIGQKAKSQIVREYKNSIRYTVDGVAKNVPTWSEAALVGDEILSSKLSTGTTKIFYNSFKSVIAFETTALTVYSGDILKSSPKLAAYEVEEEVLKSFEEFALANSLYWAIAEGYASEMAARRTAMENATKNAGEMIQKLTLVYNRSRQATITNDLIDIITGASCM